MKLYLKDTNGPAMCVHYEVDDVNCNFLEVNPQRENYENSHETPAIKLLSRVPSHVP